MMGVIVMTVVATAARSISCLTMMIIISEPLFIIISTSALSPILKAICHEINKVDHGTFKTFWILKSDNRVRELKRLKVLLPHIQEVKVQVEQSVEVLVEDLEIVICICLFPWSLSLEDDKALMAMSEP